MALIRLGWLVRRSACWGKRHTLACDHVCNLDHGVHLGFRKYAFPTSAFNIETKDSQRRYVRPIIHRCMRYECIVPAQPLVVDMRKANNHIPHGDFNLALRPSRAFWENLVLPSRYFNPIHSDHLLLRINQGWFRLGPRVPWYRSWSAGYKQCYFQTFWHLLRVSHGMYTLPSPTSVIIDMSFGNRHFRVWVLISNFG
jgi:hypothetical protein